MPKSQFNTPEERKAAKNAKARRRRKKRGPERMLKQNERKTDRRLGIKPVRCDVPLMGRNGRGCPHPRYIHRVYDDDTGKVIKRFRANTCYAHMSDELKQKLDLTTQFGRPSQPDPNAILREMFESNAAEWLEPYFEAITNSIKPVVVGNGAHARVVEYRDLRGSLQALEAVMDRIYGKPKTVSEIQGKVEFTEVEVPTDDTRQAEVAKILAQNGALGLAAAMTNPASQN